MHDKKGAFFKAENFSDSKKNTVIPSELFYSATYQSPLLPNISLQIHNSYHADMKIVSIVDRADRMLFYRPYPDQDIVSVHKLFYMCLDISSLLDGLEIITNIDASPSAKP